jgi:hypothetical protein
MITFNNMYSNMIPIVCNCILLPDHPFFEQNIKMLSNKAIISDNVVWNFFWNSPKPLNIKWLIKTMKIPAFHEINIYQSHLPTETFDIKDYNLEQVYYGSSDRSNTFELTSKYIIHTTNNIDVPNNLIDKYNISNQIKYNETISWDNINYNRFIPTKFNNIECFIFFVKSNIWLHDPIPWKTLIDDDDAIWIPNIGLVSNIVSDQVQYKTPVWIVRSNYLINNTDNFSYLDHTHQAPWNGISVKEYTECINNYEPLHPDLYEYDNNKSIWLKAFFHPIFYNFLFMGGELPITEPKECTDMYEFPMFTELFCKMLIEECEHYGKWSCGNIDEDKPYDSRIGNKENYPTQDIHMNQIGLNKVWLDIVKKYISRVAKKMYNDLTTKGYNIAFIVKYTLDGQSELKPHHDCSVYSTVTCLNTDFEGGGTHFIRQNYTHHSAGIGYTTIHPGRCTHYHSGSKITSGKRYILVSFNE